MAALRRLAARLDERVRALTARLIELAGIEGEEAGRLETALTETRRRGERPDPMTGAAGGALLGAGAGAALDLALAGLGFGVFTTLGATLSAAAGWAWCYQAAEQQRLTWSPVFLHTLTERLIARYLAIAHHGRARGSFATAESEVEWARRVHARLEAGVPGTEALRRRLSQPGSSGESLYDDVRAGVRTLVVDELVESYPQAATLFERTGAEAYDEHADRTRRAP